MNLVHRKLLVFSLLGAFATQGALVYTDSKAANGPVYSETGMRGRAIFFSHNCGACHQIHGFGGFLGPDLTNAAQRVSRARLDEILVKGSKQMPAWGFDQQQIDAVEVFLREINKTGIGQARSVVPPPMAAVLRSVEKRLSAATADPEVRKGHDLWAARCTSCHVPLCATSLGQFMAPDPSTVTARLSPEEIDQVLQKGRPERGMMPQGLEQAQRKSVITFLGWLGKQHASLQDEFAHTQQNTGLPWFEFR